MLAEITPAKHRGRYMAILNMSLLYGQIFGACMAVIFINDASNWRALTLTVMIPAVFSIVLQLLYLDESPRYELLLGNVENGTRIVCKANGIY